MIVTKFRSSTRTRVVKNRAHTKYCRALLCRGCQNVIELQGKDLATGGAARGLLYLSTFFYLLSLAIGKSTRGILPCTWMRDR